MNSDMRFGPTERAATVSLPVSWSRSEAGGGKATCTNRRPFFVSGCCSLRLMLAHTQNVKYIQQWKKHHGNTCPDRSNVRGERRHKMCPQLFSEYFDIEILQFR